MATSQNGYSANDRSVIATYDLPGGKVALRKGDVATVLLWCANEWHRRVEPLRWPGNWGYAERTIRGSSTTLSNHASGTAIDLNAPAHPLGTHPTQTFSAAQIAEIRNILAFCEGVVRWGGDYSGRKDPMHLEINAGPAAVARIADKIRNLGKDDELSEAQANRIIDQLRRDLGWARDQIMTHLGKRPDMAPLPPEHLPGVEVARRVDVGFARDQMLAEFATVKAEQERQRQDLDALFDLLERVAERVGVPLGDGPAS